MDIQQLLWAVVRGWWIILSFIFISTGMGLYYSYTQTPVYETTATLVVKPTGDISDSYEKLYSIDTMTGRTGLAITYSHLLSSQAVADLAASMLGISPSMIADYERNCVALPDSVILQIYIQGPSPFLAADLANAIGATGMKYVQQFHKMYELRQVDLAPVTTEPISPDHVQDTVLSALLGAIAGVGFAILRETLMQFFVHQSRK